MILELWITGEQLIERICVQWEGGYLWFYIYSEFLNDHIDNERFKKIYNIILNIYLLIIFENTLHKLYLKTIRKYFKPATKHDLVK